jgi:hypothetical protein
MDESKLAESYPRARLIELTQGKFAIVDSDDFDRINAHKWQAHWESSTQSFRADRSSAWCNGSRTLILMHREVMLAPSGVLIDHQNRDTLDNRKGNLRFCSASQNGANRSVRSNNTSGFKGVYWKSDRCKWRAMTRASGKPIHIGDFSSAQEAALAYDAAAVKLFGEFALTNRMLGLLP